MTEQPKLLSYCTLLYDRMDKEANSEEGDVRVWRGKVTETTNGLDIPLGSRTKVLNALRQLGCIEQVARGYRGTALAAYVLHYPPTTELWVKKISPNPLTGGPSSDMLAARLEDVKQQLGGINVPSALLNIENRLKSLETAVRQLQESTTTQ